MRECIHVHRAAVLVVVALLAGCVSPNATSTVSPASAVPSPTSIATSPTVVATRTVAPLLSPALGRCTRSNVTPQQVLEQLYALTTSADTAAVLDCYAQRLRTEAGFVDFAARWSRSGPASDISIRFLDRVKECDRFAVTAELAHGESVAHFGAQTTFFSVGLEEGVSRVYDAGSALAAADVTIVVCH